MSILGRRFVACGVLALAALAATTPSARAQSGDTRENEVKAAYLYNFAKYISWPAPAVQADPFRICVLADGEFVKSLDAIVAGEQVNGRRVVRVVPDSVAETRTCQIFFVSRSEADRAQRLVDAVRDDPVLAVGDTADFLSRGGAIAFIRDGDRLRFDVNVEEVRRSRLTISSRLLRVARRVLNASESSEYGPDDDPCLTDTARAGPRATIAGAGVVQ